MTRRLARLAAAAVLFAPAAALADDRDDRIERLERENAEMRRDIAELKASRGLPADVSAIQAAVDDYLAHSGRAAASATYAGPGGVLRPRGGVTLGGYFSTRYYASQAGGEPSFSDMRLVPQIHADVTEKIAFNAEIEFEHGGVSDEIEGEIAIEYAELSFRCSDAFTFKVGDLLVPFGWFNQNHDDPLNELSSRPDVARWIVPAAYDSPGIGAEGAIDLNEDTSLTYDAVLVNGLRDDVNSEEGTRAARGLFEEDDNHNKSAYGRVGLVPTVPFFDALNVGVSGALGKIGDRSERMRGFGADASAKHGPWEFKGEFDQFGIDRKGGSAPPISPDGTLGRVRGLHGWYAQILYRFTDPWVRSLPFAEKDASFAVVLRRDSADTNDRVHGASGVDDERAFSLGLTYRPTSRTAVKIEFRHGSSGAQGSEGQDRDAFVVEFATYF